MKNAAGVFLLLIVVMGCDISKYANSGRSENVNPARASPTIEARSPAETPKPLPTKASLEPLLKKWVGKYPYEVKLLKNPELRARLQKLMGRDFGDMDEHFSVETPMELEGGIFKASACEAHNCGANNYYIFVDVASDNINVYHVEDDKTRTYFESGKIKLPSKFAADISNE